MRLFSDCGLTLAAHVTSEGRLEPEGKTRSGEERTSGRNARGVIPNTGTHTGVLAIAGAGRGADGAFDPALVAPLAPAATRSTSKTAFVSFIRFTR